MTTTKIYTPDLALQTNVEAVQAMLDRNEIKVTERGNPRVPVTKLEEGKTYLMVPRVTKSGANFNDLTLEKHCVIEKDFDYKVRTICGCLYKNEWSGILFYVLDEDYNIIPKDIHVMSYDTSAQTSFEYDAESTELILDAQEKGLKAGLIHSHNTMAAFMSGTDETELIKNSQSYENYVSIIINNFGEYVCKRTHKAEPNVKEVIYTLLNKVFKKDIKPEIIIEDVMVIKNKDVLNPSDYSKFMSKPIKTKSNNKKNNIEELPLFFYDNDYESIDSDFQEDDDVPTVVFRTAREAMEYEFEIKNEDTIRAGYIKYDDIDYRELSFSSEDLMLLNYFSNRGISKMYIDPDDFDIVLIDSEIKLYEFKERKTGKILKISIY